MAIARKNVDKFAIDSFERFFVLGLPVEVVFPSFIGPNFLH